MRIKVTATWRLQVKGGSLGELSNQPREMNEKDGWKNLQCHFWDHQMTLILHQTGLTFDF